MSCIKHQRVGAYEEEGYLCPHAYRLLVSINLSVVGWAVRNFGARLASVEKKEQKSAIVNINFRGGVESHSRSYDESQALCLNCHSKQIQSYPCLSKHV